MYFAIVLPAIVTIYCFCVVRERHEVEQSQNDNIARQREVHDDLARKTADLVDQLARTYAERMVFQCLFDCA